jgi:DDE superfamily endonuclease
VEGADREGGGAGVEARGRTATGAAAVSLCEADAARIEAEACRPPKEVGIPVTHWSARLLAEHLRQSGFDVSDRTVGRVLRDADLQPHRQQMYLTSHDEEFRHKRDDVLRVYYETPAGEHIVCLDEKTGMQALERRYPDVPMARGQPVRREFEYIRRGTLCLMGAYNVRERKLFGFVSEDHDTRTFVDLLEIADSCHPEGRGHFVCDNLSMHDTDDVHDWLDEHPRWTLHFTPKHASWLNQIECAFSILHAKVLARGSFASVDALRDAVYAFMLWFNGREDPAFRWSYRPKSWAN